MRVWKFENPLIDLFFVDYDTGKVPKKLLFIFLHHPNLIGHECITLL